MRGYVIRVTPAGHRASAYLASGGTTNRDVYYATRMEHGRARAVASHHRATHIGDRVEIVVAQEPCRA